MPQWAQNTKKGIYEPHVNILYLIIHKKINIDKHCGLLCFYSIPSGISPKFYCQVTIFGKNIRRSVLPHKHLITSVRQ